MSRLFAWDEWIVEHIARHKVATDEAEQVVEASRAPWPEQKGDDKMCVLGLAESDRLLQVIFVFTRPDEIDFDTLTISQWADLDEEDEIVYGIHAMELTARMKQTYRKRIR